MSLKVSKNNKNVQLCIICLSYSKTSKKMMLHLSQMIMMSKWPSSATIKDKQIFIFQTVIAIMICKIYYHPINIFTDIMQWIIDDVCSRTNQVWFPIIGRYHNMTVDLYPYHFHQYQMSQSIHITVMPILFSLSCVST